MIGPAQGSGLLVAFRAADFDDGRVDIAHQWTAGNHPLSASVVVQLLRHMDFDNGRTRVLQLLCPHVKDKDGLWDSLATFDFDSGRKKATTIIVRGGSAPPVSVKPVAERSCPKVNLQRLRAPKAPKPPKPPKFGGSQVNLQAGDMSIRQDSTGTYINGKKIDLETLLGKTGKKDLSGVTVTQDSTGTYIDGKKVPTEDTEAPDSPPPKKKRRKNPHDKENSALSALWPLLILGVVLVLGVSAIWVVS